MMLHTKYQGSRPSGLRQEDFLMFLVIEKIVSEYDQEIPQSQTADNPVISRGRAAQPSRDTRKTNQAKQSALASPSR